jgi:hypothetical protein
MTALITGNAETEPRLAGAVFWLFQHPVRGVSAVDGAGVVDGLKLKIVWRLGDPVVAP